MTAAVHCRVEAFPSDDRIDWRGLRLMLLPFTLGLSARQTAPFTQFWAFV